METKRLNKYHFYRKETGLCFDPYYYFYEPIKVNDDNDINLFVMQATNGEETYFGSTHNKHYSDNFFSVFNGVVETASMIPHEYGDVYGKIVSDRYIELGTFCKSKDGKQIGRHYRYLISKYSNVICEVYEGNDLIEKIEYDFKLGFIPHVKDNCLRVKEGNYTIDEKGKSITELCDGGCQLNNFKGGIGLKFEDFGFVYGLNRKALSIYIFDNEYGAKLTFISNKDKAKLIINGNPISKYKVIKQ